jgi:DNA-binding MarR family transcriptional regulator
MTHHFLKILPLIQQLVVKLGVHRTKTGGQYGLTNMLMGVMGSILQRKDCNVRAVADENLITLPAASRMVTDLVKKGFVTRSPSQADRRVVYLHLTPGGEKIMEVVHQEAGELLGSLLDKMSIPEREALEVGLLAFVKAMQENLASTA